MKIPKKMMIFLLFFFLGVMVFTANVSADVIPDEAQVIEVLSNNADFFRQNDIIQSAVRYLGWLLVSVLQFLCNQAEKVFLFSYKLLSFGTGTEIETFVAALSPIYKALLMLSITAVGLMTMFLNIKLPDVFKNIVLSIGVITCTFFVMSQLNAALYDPSTETGLVTWALGGQESITNDIVRTNVYDLYYIDGILTSDAPDGGLAGFDQGALEQYHFAQLTDEDMKKINVGETINFEDDHLSSQAKELLSKRVVWIYGQDYVLEDVSKGLSMFGINNLGNSFYYRYKVNFFDIIVTLLAFCIVYLAVGYKVVEIIWQMVISRILVVLYSADITNRKKTMLLINSIKDGYIALFIAAVTIRMFSLFQAYINETFEANAVINVILLIFLAFAVAKGGITEKLTGHSLGASGGIGLLYGGTQMVKGAVSIAKGGVNGIAWASGKMAGKSASGDTRAGSATGSGTAIGAGVSGNSYESTIGNSSSRTGSPSETSSATGKTSFSNINTEGGEQKQAVYEQQEENNPLKKNGVESPWHDSKNYSVQDDSVEQEDSIGKDAPLKTGQGTEERNDSSDVTDQVQVNGQPSGEEEKNYSAGNREDTGSFMQGTSGTSENEAFNTQDKKKEKSNAPSYSPKSVLDDVNEKNGVSRIHAQGSVAHVLQEMNQSSTAASGGTVLDRNISPSEIAEDDAYDIDSILEGMDNETWASAFSKEQGQGHETQGSSENTVYHQERSLDINSLESGNPGIKSKKSIDGQEQDLLSRQDTKSYRRQSIKKKTLSDDKVQEKKK